MAKLTKSTAEINRRTIADKGGTTTPTRPPQSAKYGSETIQPVTSPTSSKYSENLTASEQTLVSGGRSANSAKQKYDPNYSSRPPEQTQPVLPGQTGYINQRRPNLRPSANLAPIGSAYSAKVDMLKGMYDRTVPPHRKTASDYLAELERMRDEQRNRLRPPRPVDDQYAGAKTEYEGKAEITPYQGTTPGGPTPVTPPPTGGAGGGGGGGGGGILPRLGDIAPEIER